MSNVTEDSNYYVSLHSDDDDGDSRKGVLMKRVVRKALAIVSNTNFTLVAERLSR